MLFVREINSRSNFILDPPEPECRVDQDCQSPLSCISQSCQNICTLNSPCKASQRCELQATHPTRSIACICNDGTIAGNNGECPGVYLKRKT